MYIHLGTWQHLRASPEQHAWGEEALQASPTCAALFAARVWQGRLQAALAITILKMLDDLHVAVFMTSEA